MFASIASLVDVPVRYDLAESTSPALAISDLVDPAELAGVRLGYGTTPGNEQLRQLIATEAGVDADQVLVTVGAIAALFLLAHVTCRPGDWVVIATPCFPPSLSAPQQIGAQVHPVPLSFDDGYRLPIDRLVDALTPQVKLVSLASPQNPSGVQLRDDELQAVLDAVAERAPEAVVLLDEIYREATYGDQPVTSSKAALSPQIVTCSSLSKAHGAPGLRVGWLTTTDTDLYERLRETKFLTSIACSTVDELLACRVLNNRRPILNARARFLGAALQELETWVQDQPLEFVRPDSGALCCLRLPADRFSDRDVTAFYQRLAERDTRVAPGSWFGEHDRIFRLGFGHLQPDDFTEALRRLADALPGTEDAVPTRVRSAARP
jgi:aspartate/methionine/tyrosine aminotransferase